MINSPRGVAWVIRCLHLLRARMGVEPPYLLVAWAEQKHHEGYNSTRCKYISGQLQRIAETK
jgi:hypothetical protein